MKSPFVFAGLAVVMLSVCYAHGGPVRGQYRTKEGPNEELRLEAGGNLEYRETFRANERACVIIEGDHDPVMNLKVRVHDLAGNQVASDIAGGDLLVVTWYPARTQEYIISVTSDGKIHNFLRLILK